MHLRVVCGSPRYNMGKFQFFYFGSKTNESPLKIPIFKKSKGQNIKIYFLKKIQFLTQVLFQKSFAQLS